MNVNKVFLSGRLARDPRLDNAGQDGERVNLTIAFDERVKGSDEVRYMDITLFGKGASNVAQYRAKGDEVLIEGRLTCREMAKTSEGFDRFVYSIVAEPFNGVHFGRKKGDGATDVGADTNTSAPAEAKAEIPF